MLISLNEYAQKINREPSYVRRKAEKGDFKTAQKIGRNWLIDENEPYYDKRKNKGEYRMKIYKSWSEYYKNAEVDAYLDSENGADEDIQTRSSMYEFEFGGKSSENQFYIQDYCGSYVRVFTDADIDELVRYMNDEKIPDEFIKMIISAF